MLLVNILSRKQNRHKLFKKHFLFSSLSKRISNVTVRNTNMFTSKKQYSMEEQTFRKTNFQLFQELRKAVLSNKEGEQSCQIFKDCCFRTQELLITTCNEGRRQAWLSKGTLVKCRCKKEMHRKWNQRCVARRIQGCSLDV